MTENTQELKPCECGSDDVFLRHAGVREWKVICDTCKRHGPEETDAHSSIKAWNTRTLDEQAAADEWADQENQLIDLEEEVRNTARKHEALLASHKELVDLLRKLRECEEKASSGSVFHGMAAVQKRRFLIEQSQELLKSAEHFHTDKQG